MPPLPIERLVIVGDTDFFPKTVTEAQRAQWKGWKQNALICFRTARPYLAIDGKGEDIAAVCALRQTYLHFYYYQGANRLIPVLGNFTVSPRHFNKNLLSVFATHLRDADGTLARQEVISLSVQEKLAANLGERLKEKGLHFGDEARAQEGFKSLLNYWVDLTQVNPRRPPAPTMPPAVPKA